MNKASILVFSIIFTLAFAFIVVNAQEEEVSYVYSATFDIGNGYNLVVKIQNYLPPILPTNKSIMLDLAVYNASEAQGTPVMHVTYNVKVYDANNNLLNLFGTNQDIHSMGGPLQLNLTLPNNGKYTINVQIESIGMAGMGPLLSQFKSINFPLYIGVNPDNTLVSTADIGKGYSLLFEAYPYYNSSLTKTITLAVYNGSAQNVNLVYHITYHILIKDSNGKLIFNSTDEHIDQDVLSFYYSFPDYGNYSIIVQVVSIGHPGEPGIITGLNSATFNISITKGNENSQNYLLYALVIIAIVLIIAGILLYRSFNKKRAK
ncbi:MAG TPA: hypothetical protein VKU94_00280 [Geobacterales bacterium]|nr:hypothetical protein [Geobacterales bacterium]